MIGSSALRVFTRCLVLLVVGVVVGGAVPGHGSGDPPAHLAATSAVPSDERIAGIRLRCELVRLSEEQDCKTCEDSCGACPTEAAPAECKATTPSCSSEACNKFESLQKCVVCAPKYDH